MIAVSRRHMNISIKALVITSLAGISLAGCSRFSLSQLSPTPTPTATPTSAPTQKPFTMTLKSIKNSGQTGKALFEDVGGGKTKVTITMNGQATSPQPAHIHTGSCVKSGNILYPLTSVTNGTSETILNASIQAIQANGPTVVNVHLSPSELSTIVSCGELPPSSTLIAPKR